MSNSLASVHPELISEWSEKNLPLTPDKITFGSNKRVWWKGACGHEWETSVKARSKGEKCPICSGARVIEGINDLATLKPLLAQEWSEKNELKPTEVSVASHKKIIWKCKHGHEWEASVKSRTVNGTGCPYCSHNKVLAGFNDLASQYPDIAAEWSDRNLPLLPTMVTAFANSKAWWKYTDFIFINRFGQPQHQATLNKAIRRIIRDCNDEQLLKDENAEVLLPHFSCHSLRHTFTTRMCEAGVNVKVIQDTLGHKDISTTLNIYTDVTKELRKSEFEGLDSYFKNEYNKVSV